MEDLGKETRVFDTALQWSTVLVLLIRTKERQNVPLTQVENQTPI